jgi:hypothetical protein
MQTSTEPNLLQPCDSAEMSPKPAEINSTVQFNLATAMLQENFLQRSIQNVALSLQNAMMNSLQQAALLPANSAAAAALNLQALESYLTLQQLTTVSANVNNNAPGSTYSRSPPTRRRSPTSPPRTTPVSPRTWTLPRRSRRTWRSSTTTTRWLTCRRRRSTPATPV